MSINSIINCMDDKPSEQIHKNKMLVNKEFEDKANIKGFVSYIYYPSQGGDAPGHSELEIEGNSYTLFHESNIRDIVKGLVSYIYPSQRGDASEQVQGNGNKSLSRMIEWTQMGLGSPFFRFNISVTPNQLNELRKSISITSSITCSLGAAKALK